MEKWRLGRTGKENASNGEMEKCARINLSKDVIAYSCHLITYLLDCYCRPEG